MTNTLEEPEQAAADVVPVSTQSPAVDPQKKIPHPEATRPVKVQWQYAIVLATLEFFVDIVLCQAQFFSHQQTNLQV